MRTVSLNENWKFMKLPGMALCHLPAALPGGYRFYPGQDGRDYWVMTQEV